MFSSIPAGSWLVSALAVLLVVQVAAIVLIWCAAAIIALMAPDDKRADRALEIFRILWSSSRRR